MNPRAIHAAKLGYAGQWPIAVGIGTGQFCQQIAGVRQDRLADFQRQYIHAGITDNLDFFYRVVGQQRAGKGQQQAEKNKRGTHNHYLAP